MLPDIKDNLETGLILLRRRLSEKGGPIRLDSTQRGGLQLEIEAGLEFMIIEDLSKSDRLTSSRIGSDRKLREAIPGSLTPMKI